MKFCPKCGTRLKLVREGDGDYLACPNPNCGYKIRYEGSVLVPVARPDKSPKDKIAVIEEEEGELRTLPTVRVECPKCGHKEAEFWSVQTRSSDEGATQFFRCTRCGYTWREYG
ncbi:MAG TPA: transcription factor S [Candidatus Bathyarchaeota archaeon]|nr:MAG: transcription factor S [Candidatus Bathyarchaeota archaeon]HDJ25827.1 transcription factor S [Candidatus Bathyarchaeota archaeon]